MRPAWAVLAAVLAGAAPAAAEDPPAPPQPGPVLGVTVAERARVVARADVPVDVTYPAGTVALDVAPDPSFAAAVRLPAAPRIVVRLPTGGDGAERAVWVRALDAAGQVLGQPGHDRVLLDDTPPRVAAARLDAVAPVVVCRPGGPAVAGTARGALALRLGVRAVERGSGPAQMQVAARTSAPGPWRAAGTAEGLSGPAGGRLLVRLRDRLGNVSRWWAVAVPPAPERVATPASLPFTSALECPGPSRSARIRAVRAAYTGAPANRAIVRPPGSDLDWTWYSGQGLALNWVHAGTRLNARLSREPRWRYREAVAEVIAHSVADTAPDGTRFRVNENLFTAPDDRQPPPWRDGMGTAVILALLVPALPPAAPAGERDLAIRTAGEYLATFSVDHADGGVLWSDGGPGAWYLEYAYRTQARVLNGFMQAVVSLSRFARQAERLGASYPRWADLAARARERVLAGATATARWLPAYDLGGGATRYSLTSGPAPERYRLYHVELLRRLAEVPYVPDAQREVFLRYAVAWG